MRTRAGLASVDRHMPMHAAALLLLAVLGGLAGTAAAATCHLHPPASEQEPAPRLIGPFPDAADCEAARAGRFGPLGRCHCTAAFTPRWLGDGAPTDARGTTQSRPFPDGAGQNLPLP